MNSLIIISLLIAVSNVTHGQFLNCDWVNGLDCANYVESNYIQCGSDGTTYTNRCVFAKSHCAHKDLQTLHAGACLPSEVSTTPSPISSITDGGTIVLDFFCTQLAHTDCGHEIKLVCGTDGFSYLNYCEYDKARCTHRNLHVQNFGACQS